MKATTGETIAFARQVFAGPLEDRIKQLEARNAELVEALQACLDYGSMTGAEWVDDKARAALQQEATHAGIPQA